MSENSYEKVKLKLIYAYNRMLSLEQRIEKLLSKTEALVLLCSKAGGYWALVKFCFAIPLVLTSSAMCIINSISEDANEVKIPNIVVNAVSVLIMSLNNSIKASEKCDLFRRVGQQLLLLTGRIENDNEIDDAEFKLLAMTYENLVNDLPFEEIPDRYKCQVAESFKDRYLPLQLGTDEIRRRRKTSSPLSSNSGTPSVDLGSISRI